MTAQHHDFEPVPPHSDPRIALRRALPALRPAEQIGVTDALERDLRVKVGDEWQRFRRDTAPYMTEPTDMMTSRRYAGLAFCGPSQSGKTQMLKGAICYSAICNPGRVALFQMTRDAAQEFVRDQIDPMIRNSPALRARLGKGRGADQQYQKLFSGGTQLTIDWPTPTKLSSRTIRMVLATDYDHFPDSIGGEGDAYTMMRARTRTYRSRGMVVVESSPAAPITDESWRPVHPHDAPPVAYGVLSLYVQGTRARWYWPCPHCNGEFEPNFDRLKYPKGGDPVEAGEAAEMACPHCGVLIGHHLKHELNRVGRWLHVDQNGGVCPVDSDRIARTDLLSYWLDGAAAAFSTWAELVLQWERAVERFEQTGDEGPLKTAMNTGQARPYLPRSSDSENEVTLQGLKDKARETETPKGLAPDWTRYLTVSIDTQGNRFDVGVTAWGANGRHQPIDRFELFQPPETSPDAGDRTVKPFDIAEDWAVLAPLADMAWPVEGASHALRPAALAVDMQGGGSTTENAYRFYRGRRKAGQSYLWFLTRGQGGNHTDRIWLRAPERVSGGARSKRKVASDIEILHMATDRLKDAVATSLRLTEDGRNRCMVPAWMTDAQLIEYTAERRTTKGWEKRPGMVRNESLDHMVQARALHIHLGGEKMDPERAPGWAMLGPDNTNAVRTADATPQSDGKGAAAAAVVAEPRRRKARHAGRLF